jgi:hypothetical protein
VRERDGRVTKLFLIGPQHNEDERAAHVRTHFHGVEYLDSWQADSDPPVLAPVPKSFYLNGIIDAVNDELMGGSYDAARPRRILVPRKTIERKV